MEPSHRASVDSGEDGYRVRIDGRGTVVSEPEHYATETLESCLRARPDGGGALGKGNLSPAQETGQAARGEDLLFGRGGLSIRSGSRTDLWTQRPNSGGQDFRPASKPQRHQRRQCSRGILGGYLQRQAQRGIVRALLAEFHGHPNRQNLLGGRWASGS